MNWKLVLVSLLVCLQPVRQFAQTLHPWPTRDAVWGLEFLDYDPYYTLYHTGNFTYRAIYGDTSINGMTYQKIYRFTPQSSTPGTYWCATRPDSSHRVWIVPPDSVTEILLYDFSLNLWDIAYDVYDAWEPDRRADFMVTARETWTASAFGYADGDHIALRLSKVGSSHYAVWVDGLGSVYEPFSPNYRFMGSVGNYIDCMRSGPLMVKPGHGGCNFLSAADARTSGIEVSPNPTDGLVRIHSETAHTVLQAELRDLQGRALRHWDKLPDEIDMSALPAGVYLLRIRGKNGPHTEKILKR